MSRRLSITCVFVPVLMVWANITATAESLRPHVAGELLIGFKLAATSTRQEAALRRVGGKLIQRLGTERERRSKRGGIQKVKIKGDVAEALERLKKFSSIAFVEPNYVVKSMDISDDYYYTAGGLWGLYGNDIPACGPTYTTGDYGIDAEEAWFYGYTGSQNVYVGVVDEGIQISHPDLAANIWTNPGEIADGLDNDANGYIDDINGWDFYNGDTSVFDASDGDLHGTHVAGTIGARGGME